MTVIILFLSPAEADKLVEIVQLGSDHLQN